MNKKGGTVVEATLVLPVIILSLMGIIGILMFLFEDAASQANLHSVIRTEAGRETGTFHGQAGSYSVTVDRSIKGIHSVMKGESTVTYHGAGMISRTFEKSLTGYQYLTDERKYVRYVDFFSLEELGYGDQTDQSNQ